LANRLSELRLEIRKNAFAERREEGEVVVSRIFSVQKVEVCFAVDPDLCVEHGVQNRLDENVSRERERENEREKRKRARVRKRKAGNEQENEKDSTIKDRTRKK
jgi:hypothetical protein